MTDKKSFVLYTDLREPFIDLSDEEVGKLLRATFDYIEHGILPEFDSTLKIAFRFMQTMLDRNNAKWEDERRKRSEAGKKGADARWNSSNE